MLVLEREGEPAAQPHCCCAVTGWTAEELVIVAELVTVAELVSELLELGPGAGHLGGLEKMSSGEPAMG